MKTKSIGLSILLAAVGLFTACENSNTFTEETSPQIYSRNSLTIFNCIDMKEGNLIDGWDHPYRSDQFVVTPDTDCEIDQDEYISLGVQPGSVAEEMTVTVELWKYPHREVDLDLGPNGFVFLQSIEIGTALNFWHIPNDVDHDSITFFYVIENDLDDPDDDEAMMIPSTVVNDCLIGEFEHFSKYAVGVIPGSN